MIDNRCKKLADIESQIKALQAAADEIKNEIKKDMEADSLEEIDTGKYKVRYKVVESVRLDNKALKADLPDVYSLYSKVTACKRFTVA
jgi:predicted phage-related endonuclease